MSWHLNHLEGISAFSPHQEKAEPPVHRYSCCLDAPGALEARIENSTLFVDLSDEEQRGHAGHTQLCPACAARLQEYQSITMWIRKIPLESLYEDEYEQRRCRLKEKKAATEKQMNS